MGLFCSNLWDWHSITLTSWVDDGWKINAIGIHPWDVHVAAMIKSFRGQRVCKRPHTIPCTETNTTTSPLDVMIDEENKRLLSISCQHNLKCIMLQVQGNINIKGTNNAEFGFVVKFTSEVLASSPGAWQKSERRTWYPLFAHAWTIPLQSLYNNPLRYVTSTCR